MKKFEELEKKETYLVEEEILNKWMKEDILDKCIENRKYNQNFIFYN